jgi:O-6-methylguanine DNA methyltransferase
VQLGEYFEGRRTQFDLPLGPRGTEFQRTVWHTLAGIPYGTTISYAQLARRVGKASAMRAVGAANGRNPLPIVLPCHRVSSSCWNSKARWRRRRICSPEWNGGRVGAASAASASSS